MVIRLIVVSAVSFVVVNFYSRRANLVLKEM